MNKAVYLIILYMFVTGTLHAQDEKHGLILEQAGLDYQVGRFEQVQSELSKHLYSFDDSEKQKALRLLALCCLAQDKEEEAEQYARQLITLNNYYTSVNDPIRFEELVNRLKSGLVTTITTASSVSENINEAPVPVTIITTDMIENLGYNKRLGQILAAFVPGMAEISNGLRDNMATHGAYSSEQELILVMENGHRLNNRLFNSSPMDYSISTEKIDHIEVLRGPASSLYGNVALSAVVNIITKSGAQLNGVKAKYGIGTFGTHKADLLMGTRFMDADLLVWGSLYKSDGQHSQARDAEEYSNKFYIEMDPNFHSYVDGYKDKFSYDLGLTFKLKGFDIQFSRKHGKKLSQYGDNWGYYDYDKYRKIYDNKPGIGTQETHLEVGGTRVLGTFTINASVYGDWYEHTDYMCISPEFTDESEYEIYTRGEYSYRYLKENTMGGNLRVASNYQLGSMKGNILAGCQFEHFRFADNAYLTGEEYTGPFYESDVFDKSVFDERVRQKEHILSFYAQDKHNITPKLIFNAGLRYDINYRDKQDNAKAFSPRLALIYTPKQDLSMRLTFAKSFVDMSYYNRIIQNYYEGSEYLPQYLTAMQFNILGKIEPIHIGYDVNIVYNNYQNLYYQVYHESSSHWENEGSFKNISFEANLTYTRPRLSTILTFYWSKDLDAENYYYSEAEKQVYAVPHLTANLNAGYTFLAGKKHGLKVYGNANLVGSKLINSLKIEDRVVEDEKTLDKTLVFDLGIKYTFWGHLQIGFDCENVFDTNRFLSGPNYNMYPYRQRGRTIMGSVAYQF